MIEKQHQQLDAAIFSINKAIKFFLAIASNQRLISCTVLPETPKSALIDRLLLKVTLTNRSCCTLADPGWYLMVRVSSHKGAQLVTSSSPSSLTLRSISEQKLSSTSTQSICVGTNESNIYYSQHDLASLAGVFVSCYILFIPTLPTKQARHHVPVGYFPVHEQVLDILSLSQPASHSYGVHRLRQESSRPHACLHPCFTNSSLNSSWLRIPLPSSLSVNILPEDFLGIICNNGLKGTRHVELLTLDGSPITLKYRARKEASEIIIHAPYTLLPLIRSALASRANVIYQGTTIFAEKLMKDKFEAEILQTSLPQQAADLQKMRMLALNGGLSCLSHFTAQLCDVVDQLRRLVFFHCKFQAANR